MAPPSHAYRRRDVERWQSEIVDDIPGGHTWVQPQDYRWFYNTTPPHARRISCHFLCLADRSKRSFFLAIETCIGRNSWRPGRNRFSKRCVSYKNTFGYTLPLSDSELVMDSGTVNDKWTGVYTTNPNILPNG